MLAESKRPAPRFLGEPAPAKPRWPEAQRPEERQEAAEPAQPSPRAPAGILPMAAAPSFVIA